MNVKTLELKMRAEEAKFLYKTNQISREEAKTIIMEYIDTVNEKGKELAKKYNQKYKPVSFIGFLR